MLNLNKNEKHEEEAKQLRERCQDYESEITKLLNRSRVLEEEIRRLN